MNNTGLNNTLYAKGAEPLDSKTKIEGSAADEAKYIAYAWVGLVFYSVEDHKHYKVTALDGEGYVSSYVEFGAGGGDSGSVRTVNGTHPDASGDIKLDIVSKADCTMDSEKIIVGLLNKDDDTLFNLDIGAVSTTGSGVMTPAMLTKLNNVPTSIAVPDSSFQESQLYDEYKNFGEVITFENLD